MYYKDKWFTWYYDGVEMGHKTSLDSKFTISVKPTIDRKVNSYKEELLKNAELTRAAFAEPFDLMFSGGVDSEAVLRSYLELKIPVNVYTFKYENDYNLFDLEHARRICRELNVKLNIIDFNLKKFYENDAYDVWRTGYYLAAGQLPHMKMFDYLDNIPIMGSANPLWEYHDNKWTFDLDEKYHSQSIYCNTVNRPAIIDWYEYSPELIIAYMNHRVTYNLLKKPGNWKTFEMAKYLLYKSIWKDIVIRPKYIGYEGTQPPGEKSSRPAFISEFEKIHVGDRKNTVFSYSNEELVNLLCKEGYRPEIL